MPALNFLITNAGKAAIAASGSIGPVVLSKVAVGSSGYTATGAQTALVAQIKQITPEGSSVPTPGTIHITASDSSADSYTVREVGLITSTGTLFAIYAQTDPILIKGSGSVALFALDFVMTGVPAGSVTIGNASFQYPPASETAQGVAEIATQAETDAGLDDARIVTPKKLAAVNKWVVKTGDTMTGPLTLPGDPASVLQAAPKQYVDNAVVSRVAKSGDTMTGPLTLPGSPSSGLHASTKAYTDAGDMLKVNKAGDTMTGPLTLPGDPTAALHAATKQYIDGLLLGIIVFCSQTAEPAGWLKCNGQAVSRTTYAALFGRIGTTFGAGNGSTTFNVPEIRGEFVRGLDEGRGVDPGRLIGTAQADMLEAHTHTVGLADDSSASGSKVKEGSGNVDASFTTSSNGGTETRPRNVAFPFIIKF